MMASMLMAQQKRDDYIKQLASKVDVPTTHNKILEAQIAQQASFSSTPLGRLPSKPERNPHRHYNYVTLKEEVEDFTDPENVPIEEGREIIMVESKERNNSDKAATFIENESVEIPPFFHLSFLTKVASLSPTLWERRKLREPCVI